MSPDHPLSAGAGGSPGLRSAEIGGISNTMADDPVATLCEFLKFASVSTDSRQRDAVRGCAEWLQGLLAGAGLEARLDETEGHPVVLARSEPDPSKRTVLIYGHYDVQPPEPLDEWDSDPFDPQIRDGRIVARGSSDNKGQIFSHIRGVTELLARDGALPVNVIFLIEGEEEIGSPHLASYLRQHREELKCDLVAISDTGMVADFAPTLTYGLRGIACMEVIAHGPVRDLHSGIFGGAVANPATAIGRLIASLHDPEGRVRIPGFYDAVLPPKPWEQEMAARLKGNDPHIAALAGVEELFGETGFNAYQRIGFRPTAEVNGIGGGYQGEGSKTVLPREAFVKLSFRLVPDQRPEEILERAREFLLANSPPGIRLEVRFGHSGHPYFVDPKSPDGEAAARALREAFGAEPTLIREGGSIPILQDLKQTLGVDSLLLALASPDAQAHSPNENFPIRNLETGIRLNQVLLRELAAV